MTTAGTAPDIGPLDRAELGQVLELIEHATSADGVAPVSEHGRLHLQRGGGVDLVARLDGSVIGYAHLDEADAELVVDPARRRRGAGTALLSALERHAAELRVWAHGDSAPAAALAAAQGFRRVRELWQMARALSPDGPDAPAAIELPDGFRLRAFRPGQDEEAWLAVNSRAFAHHPEQGSWTATDLAEREASDWFDPAGLFVAEDVAGASGAAGAAGSARMAGFHWTKEHRSTTGAPEGPGSPGSPESPESKDPVGEVYVLAVDPAYQGRGLGPALTAAGLRHLAGRGLGRVMLYVDGDNAAAIATYRRLGFDRASLDVMYAR